MSTVRNNYLKENITWEETTDPEYPYSAKIDQDNYSIRLNDFPAESLYTLIVNNEEVEDFEDWPEQWIRTRDAQVLTEQRDETIRQLINELKLERDRQIIFRFYIAEESKEQICRELALTSKQFDNVIYRAKERYKDLYLAIRDRTA